MVSHDESMQLTKLLSALITPNIMYAIVHMIHMMHIMMHMMQMMHIMMQAATGEVWYRLSML